MLLLIGQAFMRKNVDRWFLPDTQQVIQDGTIISKTLQKQIKLRLNETISNAIPTSVVGIDI
jgi:nitrogen fixation/metabolism regulation signal transduction histidine kinase